MKKGDLVRISGACYDAPIDHHEHHAAIWHFECLLPNWTLGVILEQVPGDNTTWGWCQVLTCSRTVWVNGLDVRAV